MKYYTPLVYQDSQELQTYIRTETETGLRSLTNLHSVRHTQKWTHTMLPSCFAYTHTNTHTYAYTNKRQLCVSEMNNATVRLVGCTDVPGASWMLGCARTSTHTLTHTQCSVSRWLCSFYRAGALSTPPLFLSLLYECINTQPHSQTHTHAHTRAGQGLQANSARWTHILAQTHQTPNTQTVYGNPTGVLEAFTHYNTSHVTSEKIGVCICAGKKQLCYFSFLSNRTWQSPETWQVYPPSWQT